MWDRMRRGRLELTVDGNGKQFGLAREGAGTWSFRALTCLTYASILRNQSFLVDPAADHTVHGTRIRCVRPYIRDLTDTLCQCGLDWSNTVSIHEIYMYPRIKPAHPRSMNSNLCVRPRRARRPTAHRCPPVSKATQLLTVRPPTLTCEAARSVACAPVRMVFFTRPQSVESTYWLV